MPMIHVVVFALMMLAPCSLVRAAPDRDTEVRAKDIAIILPAQGNHWLPADSGLFPAAWWDDIAAAFALTSVGKAMDEEDRHSDWRLVAVRFAPCQALAPVISPRNTALCQPELRLVWQPIQQLRRGNRWVAYADDRAIHALYHLDAEPLLGRGDAAAWRRLAGLGWSLTAADEQRYAALNAKVAALTIDQLQALRGQLPAERFTELGERPEFAQGEEAKAFLERLGGFLRQHARPELLHQLTAFSLPEGRDPPMIDEWVFVAFQPAAQGQRLAPQPLTIRSRRDGRLLVDYGLAARGSVRRDDAVLQERLDLAQGADRQELEEAVIWTFPERQLKAAQIANPDETHVAHTSCISCHKLGGVTFDLHNLSYLEDQAISISPRVEADVARELRWLNARRIHQ